jgi:hypothetical protein
MRDYERVVGLFTEDGVVRVSHINAEVVGQQPVDRDRGPVIGGEIESWYAVPWRSSQKQFWVIPT